MLSQDKSIIILCCSDFYDLVIMHCESDWTNWTLWCDGYGGVIALSAENFMLRRIPKGEYLRSLERKIIHIEANYGEGGTCSSYCWNSVRLFMHYWYRVQMLKVIVLDSPFIFIEVTQILKAILFQNSQINTKTYVTPIQLSKIDPWFAST